MCLGVYVSPCICVCDRKNDFVYYLRGLLLESNMCLSKTVLTIMCGTPNSVGTEIGSEEIRVSLSRCKSLLCHRCHKERMVF